MGGNDHLHSDTKHKHEPLQTGLALDWGEAGWRQVHFGTLKIGLFFVCYMVIQDIIPRCSVPGNTQPPGGSSCGLPRTVVVRLDVGGAREAGRGEHAAPDGRQVVRVWCRVFPPCVAADRKGPGPWALHPVAQDASRPLPDRKQCLQNALSKGLEFRPRLLKESSIAWWV